jgi:predicted transcriptional regulator
MPTVQHRLSIVVEPKVYQQLKKMARTEDRTITAIVHRALAIYAQRGPLDDAK